MLRLVILFAIIVVVVASLYFVQNRFNKLTEEKQQNIISASIDIVIISVELMVLITIIHPEILP